MLSIKYNVQVQVDEEQVLPVLSTSPSACRRPDMELATSGRWWHETRCYQLWCLYCRWWSRGCGFCDAEAVQQCEAELIPGWSSDEDLIISTLHCIAIVCQGWLDHAGVLLFQPIIKTELGPPMYGLMALAGGAAECNTFPSFWTFQTLCIYLGTILPSFPPSSHA